MTEQNKNNKQGENSKQLEKENKKISNEKIMKSEDKKPEIKLEEKTIMKTEKKEQFKPEEKLPEKKEEPKLEVKKEEKKIEKLVQKKEATARGVSMPTSKKHCMYICSFIKNKKIDEAIADLDKVLKYKKPVPFKGEIPHRKGKGIMSGRYPQKATKLFIKLLKGLRGNALVNGFDLEKTRIVEGISNWASRPARSMGKAKRTHVLLIAKEVESE